MAVESATTIAALNALWPLGTDAKQEGDNHIRLIKSVLKADAASKAELTAAMPVGSVLDYTGASAPAGWLLCSGQAVSRTTYAALFAVLGGTYGVGDGSTTFNVPDLRGRVVAGLDGGAARLPGWVLATAGGAASHTLAEAEMPAHAHMVNVSLSGTTGGRSAAHTHSVTLYDTAAWSSNAFAMGRGTGAAVGTGTIPAEGGEHTHSFGASGSFPSDYRGSSTAHNNVQPTIALNKIIKT